MINANSEVCASDIDVKKDVRLAYPKALHNTIMINGFNTTTNNTNTTNGIIILLKEPKVSSIPIVTKNTVKKKSRKGLIFATISKLYGRLARATPAKKAPIEIEKPDSTVGLNKAVDSDQANIEEANRREKNAVKFYSQAANQVPEQEIKDFFKALMEIESDHIVLTDKK